MERARIIVLAAQGLSNAEIGRRVGCHVDTVRQWRGRFAEDGRVSTLDDRPRSGRPPRVAAATRCDVVKLACDKPANHGVQHRVTAVQRAQHRVAVGDVADGVIGDVDAQLRDAGVQLGGVSHQEPNRMTFVCNGFRTPTTDKPGTARNQDPHDAYPLRSELQHP